MGENCRKYREPKRQGIREETKMSWRGSNLNSLKEDLIDELQKVSDLRPRDRIDIFYFDSHFNEWVKCDDVKELYAASKGQGIGGGHKVTIEVRCRDWELRDDQSDAGSTSDRDRSHRSGYSDRDRDRDRDRDEGPRSRRDSDTSRGGRDRDSDRGGRSDRRSRSRSRSRDRKSTRETSRERDNADRSSRRDDDRDVTTRRDNDR